MLPLRVGRNWYGHSLEAMFQRALADRLAPAARAALTNEGLPLGNFKAMYSSEDMERFVSVAAQRLYVGTPKEQAIKDIGERTVSGYGQTFIGQATLAMLKLLGPKQGLKRLQQNLRSANDYTVVAIEELGQSHYRVRINDPGTLRHLHHGILLGGQKAAGAPNGWVDLKGVEGENAVFELGFDAAVPRA